jgi:hypothetical protein
VLFFLIASNNLVEDIFLGTKEKEFDSSPQCWAKELLGKCGNVLKQCKFSCKGI